MSNLFLSPLVQQDTVDTLCHVSDCLEFITQSVGISEAKNVSESAQHGSFLLLKVINQAVEFEIARIDGIVSPDNVQLDRLSSFEADIIRQICKKLHKKGLPVSKNSSNDSNGGARH